MNGNDTNENPIPPTIMPPPLDMAPLAKPPSNWPKVLGILMIVFGSLGALGNCWGVAVPFVMPFFRNMMPKGQPDVFEIFDDWQIWIVGNAVISLVLSTLLIILGVGLLKRRHWTVGICPYWSIVKILVVISEATLQYKMNVDQMQTISQQTPGMPGINPGVSSAIGIFSFVVTLLWGCTLPVFLLIWFKRSKIRTETAAWAERRSIDAMQNV